MRSLIGITALVSAGFLIGSMPASAELQENTTKVVGVAQGQSDAALTQEQKSLARQWQLTEADYAKYLKIMKGPRGVWSPDLDPITALGVMETDPIERARYAEIWMRVESRRAELELAFEVERLAAAERILGDMKVVNDERFKQEYEDRMEAKASRYQVMLFTTPTCESRNCQKMMRELLGSVSAKGGSSLQVYFSEGATADDIAAWAQDLGITPDVVRAKKISLHYQGESFKTYDIDPSELPEVRVLDRETGDVKATFTSY